MTTGEVRQELYDLIRSDVDFEQKARDVLELGEKYLNIDNGHLTRIDQDVGHWEAIVSTDPPGGEFPPGLELDLDTTYCRRTIESESAIALHDAPNQGWDDDPAFEEHGLHCYHGTTLVVDEDVYGTVCFVAEDARQEPFSNGEMWFIELLTRLLERELEREQHETQLTKQANLANVLNRVLRHNLRNDISIIRGFTRRMADRLEECPESEPVRRKITQLLSLSEKARDLDRIIASDSQRRSVDVVSLVENIVGEVTRDYPSASVSIECDEEITAPVFPSFERAVEELVENAVKHGGDAPTVTVGIERVPNAVVVRITDDGPGLADHEAEVFETGRETPLTHGSGLGLWLTHWIVTSHDGSVDTHVADDGTTITISVPQQPAANVQEKLSRLTRARDQYQAAFEEAYDGMLIIDDDARIIDANSAAARIYGVSKSELLGRSISEFHPDDRNFEAAWAEFRESSTERDTTTITGADGESRPVEYSATTDIVPGEHLVIYREISNQPVHTGDVPDHP